MGVELSSRAGYIYKKYIDLIFNKLYCFQDAKSVMNYIFKKLS